jgi:ABC-2 type transport system ATP-binding protein
MILNIIAPDAGAISLFGQPNTARGVLDRVGYLPEERGLYKKMQVKRVLLFLAELKGVGTADAAKRIDEWLERFSLSSAEKNWGDAKVDELSRGMQQKVQFIATLLHDPDLVILDEPFSGLDPINAQALKDAVIELKQRGKTVIFSTHVMDNAEKMCDSVCIIAGGNKVLDGGLAAVRADAGRRNVAIRLAGGAHNGVGEVLRDPQLVAKLEENNQFFDLELAANADSQVLLRRLIDAGASIERFEMVQPSLHQIFLQRVGFTGVEKGMTGNG